MEPKSIHTWFEPKRSDILAYQVDVCVVKFPASPEKAWLYFFALQVDFINKEESGHGGLQWAEVMEFKNSNNMGINWGGGSQTSRIVGMDRTNKPFEWKCGQWYCYRIDRLAQDVRGLFPWRFSVLDLDTKTEMSCGTIHTESKFISQAYVFTETGYGVRCDTPEVVVHWRDPLYRIPDSQGSPDRGIATYNGTCIDPHNTNQGLISLKPKTWFHKSNSSRLVKDYNPLWNQ